MTDQYEKEERLAIQQVDGIAPSDVQGKGEATLPCHSIQKLLAHRERVLADRAAKHAKKYGIDQKSRSGGE